MGHGITKPDGSFLTPLVELAAEMSGNGIPHNPLADHRCHHASKAIDLRFLELSNLRYPLVN